VAQSDPAVGNKDKSNGDENGNGDSENSH
jgi:hypothetical protein